MIHGGHDTGLQNIPVRNAGPRRSCRQRQRWSGVLLASDDENRSGDTGFVKDNRLEILAVGTSARHAAPATPGVDGLPSVRRMVRAQRAPAGSKCVTSPTSFN